MVSTDRQPVSDAHLPRLALPESREAMVEHLARHHNMERRYLVDMGLKTLQEIHAGPDGHKPYADAAVWKEGAPRLTGPYDHSPHRHPEQGEGPLPGWAGMQTTTGSPDGG